MLKSGGFGQGRSLDQPSPQSRPVAPERRLFPIQQSTVKRLFLKARRAATPRSNQASVGRAAASEGKSRELTRPLKKQSLSDRQTIRELHAIADLAYGADRRYQDEFARLRFLTCHQV